MRVFCFPRPFLRRIFAAISLPMQKARNASAAFLSTQGDEACDVPLHACRLAIPRTPGTPPHPARAVFTDGTFLMLFINFATACARRWDVYGAFSCPQESPR
jgi:hypothetical protein